MPSAEAPAASGSPGPLERKSPSGGQREDIGRAGIGRDDCDPRTGTRQAAQQALLDAVVIDDDAGSGLRQGPAAARATGPRSMRRAPCTRPRPLSLLPPNRGGRGAPPRGGEGQRRGRRERPRGRRARGRAGHRSLASGARGCAYPPGQSRGCLLARATPGAAAPSASWRAASAVRAKRARRHGRARSRGRRCSSLRCPHGGKVKTTISPAYEGVGEDLLVAAVRGVEAERPEALTRSA